MSPSTRVLALAALVAFPTALPAASAASPQRLDEPAARAALDERLPGATLRWDAAQGVARALLRIDAATPAGTSEARARSFLAAHGDLLGGLRSEDLALRAVTSHRRRTVVRLQQLVAGIPVEGRGLTVSLSPTGRVRSVLSDFLPIVLPAGAPDVGPEAARAAVRERFGDAPVGSATKVVLALAPGSGRVAYRVPVARVPLVLHYDVWVAADDGTVLRVAPAGRDMPVEVGR